MRKKSWFVVPVLLALLGQSCSRDPGTAATKADVLPAIFPDYCDVTVPVNIAPLNFALEGSRALKAVYSVDGCEVLTVSGRDHVEVDEADWHRLLAEARGRHISVELSAWNRQHPEGVAFRPFTITVVPDSIDPWLCYRLIDPGYESWGQMGIYQRALGSFEEKSVVTNHADRRRCVNCHSFAAYDPQTMMFHQRSVDPATVILHDGVLDRVDLRAIGIRKQGLYCKWHPSGRYIIFSNNGTHQSFFDHGRKVLEVYDTFSSLFLYDVATKEVTVDTLLYNTTDMQTFASWSPDGRQLYYCTAPQTDGFPEAYDSVHYSIARIGFDAATGRFDGQVDTVYNARTEGGSAAFPRISADGRYLLFTLASCGTFPVYHPEASLQIIDLADGRRLDTSVLRSDESESYHDWSSTGRWMVFQSRRMDGRHTRLMLAHFDRNGRIGKPFMLPQRNPEDNLTRLSSYNVPEFIKAPVAHNFD